MKLLCEVVLYYITMTAIETHSSFLFINHHARYIDTRKVIASTIAHNLLKYEIYYAVVMLLLLNFLLKHSLITVTHNIGSKQ